MGKKVGKNIIYQTIYQILTIITPLITSPYISRILGAEGIGIYSYTLTTANYFVLFGMMGIVNYGSRTIAEKQKNIYERSKAFWNIYVLQLFSSSLMAALYVIFLFFVNQNKLVALIQGITVFSCTLDINWFFFGIEKFEVTVTRNIIIKIATVIGIIFFVNKDTGVIAYALVMGVSTFLSYVVLWPFLKKEVIFVMPKKREVIQHIMPNLKLFIPILAITIFCVMDKTMLGLLVDLKELGYYSNADKVINIPIGIFSGFGTVFMPRITALCIDLKNKEQVRRILENALELYSFFGMALSFGLGAIANEFAPTFFGIGYEPCIYLIIMFCPVLIIKAYSSYVRMNILVPFKKEKQYTIAVCVGAVINLIINILLIPKLGAYGAVIGTFFAELVVCVVQLHKLPIHLGVRNILYNVLPYAIFGLIMCVGVRNVARLNVAEVWNVIFEIGVGFMVYSLCCLIFWTVNKNSTFHLLIVKFKSITRKKT